MTPDFFTRDGLAELIGKGVADVGEHTYGKPSVRWWGEAARLQIGRYCSIADGVTIFLGGNHRVDWISTYPFSRIDRWPEAAGIDGHPSTKGDVRIGNDVWIGDGAAILSGVTIGDGAVIGARAVVSRDVAPYAVVAGNPALMIRKRFTDDVVRRLLRVAWWSWSDEQVREIVPLLMCGDVDRFLSFAEKGTAISERRRKRPRALAALRRLLP